MSLGGRPLISSCEPNQAIIKRVHVRVRMKRYASPGGEIANNNDHGRIRVTHKRPEIFPASASQERRRRERQVTHQMTP